MEHLLQLLAHHWQLSPAQYWHLRLLSALSLGPLLGVLYLVFFGRLAPRKPRGAAPRLWVNSSGQLLSKT